MAVGQHEAVAVGPRRVGRIVLEDAAVEDVGERGQRHGRALVAALGLAAGRPWRSRGSGRSPGPRCRGRAGAASGATLPNEAALIRCPGDERRRSPSRRATRRWPTASPAAASCQAGGVERRPVALVTGGSRGIGAATARRPRRAGWDVACQLPGPGRRRGRRWSPTCEADAVAGRSRCGPTSPRPDDVEPLFAAVDAALGPLDLLVNNAGVVSPAGRSTSYTRRAARRRAAAQRRSAPSSSPARPSGGCRRRTAAAAVSSSTSRRGPPSSAAPASTSTTRPARRPSTP